VKSVTSGRVVVDFNHPLAGEQVVYSIKVHEIVTEDAARAEALLSSLGVKGTVSAGAGGNLSITLEKGTAPGKADAVRRSFSFVLPNAQVKPA
jgi:FKBP-type peptidyl-prolyl cis-trans isomerase 2